ncbi:MAG: thiamine phosphate synthase [bacterium]
MNNKIYLITPPDDNFLASLPEVLDAGVDWLQYRRDNLTDRAKLEELRQVSRVVSSREVKLFVNDRPDLALAAEADGVHLGGEDLPPEAVKKQWPNLIVGATCRAGEKLPPGADYYSVGPVFTPYSKQLDINPCGWDGVRKVLSRLEKPLFAIGGLTPERLEGCPPELAGIAVIDAVWSASSPAVAVEKLQC